MNYQKLTKAELATSCEHKDAEIASLKAEIEANSLTHQIDNLMNEVSLLGKDLMLAIEYLFNLGVDTRKFVYSLQPIKAQNNVTLPELPEKVFPY